MGDWDLVPGPRLQSPAQAIRELWDVSDSISAAVAFVTSSGVRDLIDLVGTDLSRLELTAREFELLAYLMRHPNQVLSRAQILNAVWGYDYDPGTNVLDVYIGYLRRKLAEADGDAPIETVRSAGYRLVSADA